MTCCNDREGGEKLIYRALSRVDKARASKVSSAQTVTVVQHRIN